MLVNPQRFPDPEARFRAASAVELVDRATVVSSLAQAIDDATLVIWHGSKPARALAHGRAVKSGAPWPMRSSKRGRGEGRFCLWSRGQWTRMTSLLDASIT